MRLHNRQIKATFWSDPDLLQWPRDKRWFYEGLTQLADDSGCLEDSSFAFKLHLFPSPLDSDMTVELLTKWRDELVGQGKLVPYEVVGKRYLFMVNFHKHQTLDKPTPPSKASIPLPPWVIWEEVIDEKGRVSRRQSRYVVIGGHKPDNGRTTPGRVPVELEPELELELEPELELNNNVGQAPDPAPEKVPYKKVIDRLNEVCGTNFKHDIKTTQSHVKARWNEGFRLDDFYKVIENKARDWLTDPERVQFLRPQTLFGTKFESYLNQREVVNGSGPKPREPSADRKSAGTGDGSNWDGFYAPGAAPPKV